MNREEIKGESDKAKGYVKDKAGEILNDPELEAEGEIERGTGGLGKAKRKVKEGVEDVAEAGDDDR